MPPNTAAKAKALVAKKGTTLKRAIWDACQEPKTCYELEDLLNRTHQSVSGSIRFMVLEGLLEILPYTRKNQFGNDVRVYKSTGEFTKKT